MKKIQSLAAYFFPLLVLFAHYAQGQQIDDSGYRITGTIRGVDSGLVRMLSDKGQVLDSAVIVAGKFSLQGKIGEAVRLPFTVTPGNWNFRAFVADTTIELSVDTAGAQYYGEGASRSAMIWDIEETGPELSGVYTAYKRATDLKYYISLYTALRKKSVAAMGNEEAAARVRQEWDSASNEMLARQKAWIENYISHNPTSTAGVYLFYEYYGTTSNRSVSYLDAVLGRFSGAATSSPYYKELLATSFALKYRQPGSLVPDFTLLQRDGSPFHLSSTRGSYTLIDFWASWCTPCRKVIPAWKEVYARYKDRGFTIVSLSTDRERKDWVRALDKEQMPWVQVLDNQEEGTSVSGMFGIELLPFYLLLDKEGKVLVATQEEEVVRKKIGDLFR